MKNPAYFIPLALFLGACNDEGTTQILPRSGPTSSPYNQPIPLNDTGVARYLVERAFAPRPNRVECGPNDSRSATDNMCPGTPNLPQSVAEPDPAFPGQDADHGRDTRDDLDEPGGGRLGFRYTKLDAGGAPLTNQSVTYEVQPWSCVRDEVTGRVWEVKTDDGGLRDYRHLYRWHDPNPDTNGGFAGDRGEAGADFCGDQLDHCDTHAYIEEINQRALCGFTDWRLPLRVELLSLLDYSTAEKGSMIDLGYFPHAAAKDHWTGQTAVYPDLGSNDGGGRNALEVHLHQGYAEDHSKTIAYAVDGNNNLLLDEFDNPIALPPDITMMAVRGPGN